jgi:glycosyltransferase involved in cell wall biosynthesis
MNILFISRKKVSGIGGLSRFYAELSSHFAKSILRPDLIHLCDATLLPLGYLLKLLFRKPITVTVHGLDLVYQNKIYQTILQNLLPQADAIIVGSSPAKSLLKPFSIDESKILVIPHGISTSHLNLPLLKENSPSLQGKIVLLTVGNLVLRKGHVWFLRKVFRKLSSKFVYFIVGDGIEKEEIIHTVERLHLLSRVFVLGRISNSKLAHLYQISHIYVCPNQSVEGDFEGFGIAAGEAASLGLPVIASKVDGIPQVIRNNQNGILVEPEPETFIQAINKLKDPLLRKKLSQKARIYTQTHYNWQKTTQKYANVFQTIVKS